MPLDLDLPTPGGDPGNWGTRLNNALEGTGPGTLDAALSATYALKSRSGAKAVGAGELVFNVLDYNADNTGVAAAHTQIQAAITAAVAAGGGTVYLPPGTYSVGAFIALKDKVSIVGAGREATILKARAGLATGIIVGATADSASDLTIRDLTLDGDYATNALSIRGVQVTAGARLRIRDITVRNTGYGGILLQTGTVDSTIEGCRIENVGLGSEANGFGISFVGLSHRCKALHNRVIGARGMGIGGGSAVGNAPQDVEVSGNYIDQTGSSTYEAIGFTAGCDRLIVRGNQIFNSMDNGISVSCSEATVVGNIVNGAQNSGIHLGGLNCTCTGNVVKNSGREVGAVIFAGILLSGSTGSVVTGNRCFDDQGTKTQDYGIRESAGTGCDYNVIAANVVRGNLTGGTSVSGANTIAANNVA